jgi:hypothetical protein
MASELLRLSSARVAVRVTAAQTPWTTSQKTIGLEHPSIVIVCVIVIPSSP